MSVFVLVYYRQFIFICVKQNFVFLIAYDIVLPEEDNQQLLQYLYKHGRVKNIQHDYGEEQADGNKQIKVSVQMADYDYEAFLELQERLSKGLMLEEEE